MNYGAFGRRFLLPARSIASFLPGYRGFFAGFDRSEPVQRLFQGYVPVEIVAPVRTRSAQAFAFDHAFQTQRGAGPAGGIGRKGCFEVQMAGQLEGRQLSGLPAPALPGVQKRRSFPTKLIHSGRSLLLDTMTMGVRRRAGRKIAGVEEDENKKINQIKGLKKRSPIECSLFVHNSLLRDIRNIFLSCGEGDRFGAIEKQQIGQGHGCGDLLLASRRRVKRGRRKLP